MTSVAPDTPSTSPQSAGASPLTEQLNQSAGSFELVLSAVLLGFLGYWIDRWSGTSPVFMVALTILGFLGAGLSMYYRYKHQISVLNAETASLKQAARDQQSGPAETDASRRNAG